MHRSGTSALCAALAACGASFGSGLIDPMAEVNEDGFWEDAVLVELNESLLALVDSTWFAPSPQLPAVDWLDQRFAALRTRGLELLAAGFGDGALQAMKDPRLCLTLPFWLSICAELGLPSRVCISSRSPLEIAGSLYKRDGLPLGYGLRLYVAYRERLEAALPGDVLHVNYAELLADAPVVMQRLALDLPLSPSEEQLAAMVRPGLRHQVSESTDSILSNGDHREVKLAELKREISELYPTEQVMAEFAHSLVSRGLELSRVGEAHSEALATLDQRDADVAALAAEHCKALATVDERDADIESLSGQHRAALATIDERDEQIREFDRRLAKLGEEHTHAQKVVRERDAQLESIYNLPGLGIVIRLLRKNAQG